MSEDVKVSVLLYVNVSSKGMRKSSKVIKNVLDFFPLVF